MEHQEGKSPRGIAATKALAAVGFIVLIIIGMALAVYAARFVPGALSRIGASVGSIFSSSRDAASDLVVVNRDPAPEETLPFPDEPAATSTEPVAYEEPAAEPAPTYTRTTVTRVGPPAPYGLSDLAVENVRTGYLTSSNTASFRQGDEVPEGEHGAVRFAIVNRGTNVSGRFMFEAELPTNDGGTTYESRAQQSLRPGERIEYTLGFTEGREGSGRRITITADSEGDVRESDERNNVRSVTLDIEN
jgi:hypothetical protein